MANKNFSIYSNENYQPDESDHLIIEVGNNHFCLVIKSRAGHVNALEWFTFTEEEKQNTDLLFKEFVDASSVLGRSYSTTALYINNDLQVLVPRTFFQQELVDDYLEISLGGGLGFSTAFDEILENKGPINVYRFKSFLSDYIKGKFEISKIRHTTSRLLEKWMLIKNMPDVLMNVVFYENSFIAAVFKDGQLLLMRYYQFQVPEDVVYHWLNLVKQLELNADELIINISGVIDIPSALHSILLKYFKNVNIETIQLGKINLTGNQYPLHYFTPLFNLAI